MLVEHGFWGMQSVQTETLPILSHWNLDATTLLEAPIWQISSCIPLFIRVTDKPLNDYEFSATYSHCLTRYEAGTIAAKVGRPLDAFFSERPTTSHSLTGEYVDDAFWCTFGRCTVRTHSWNCEHRSYHDHALEEREHITPACIVQHTLVTICVNLGSESRMLDVLQCI